MKYMGSKASVSKFIAPIINAEIYKRGVKRYIEPFVGGANMTSSIRCEEVYASDANRYLIALFKYLQEGKKLPEEVSREQYVDVREHLNDGKYEDWFCGAVGFLAGFNGRWFDGSYAGTSIEQTPNGPRERDYYRESKDNILRQMPSIMHVNFSTCDYREWDEIIMQGDCVVYLDPPYDGTKEYGAVRGFNNKTFWEYARKWSKAKNVAVFISEENAPKDFVAIWEKKVTRSIRATDKSEAVEKLFVYAECIDNTDDEELEWGDL